MKTRRTPPLKLVTFGITFLMTTTVFSRPMGHYGHWKMVQDISRDTSTPQKKAEVTTALLNMVQDDAGNVYLRQFAVEKLGELEASETRDVLKELAEGLKWTDATRQLKRSATLAYWRIRIAEEKPKQAQEDLLILLLWGKNHPPPHADVVPWWAAEELANRGVKRALPEISKAIAYRDPTSKGNEFIRLCSAKVELISASANRQEALTQALGSVDPLMGQALKRWAIAELGKLGTDEARRVLVGYALDLQQTHYDQSGELKTRPQDRIYLNAAEYYNIVLETLRDKGMNESEIKAAGLKSDKCFLVAP